MLCVFKDRLFYAYKFRIGIFSWKIKTFIIINEWFFSPATILFWFSDILFYMNIHLVEELLIELSWRISTGGEFISLFVRKYFYFCSWYWKIFLWGIVAWQLFSLNPENAIALYGDFCCSSLRFSWQYNLHFLKKFFPFLAAFYSLPLVFSVP